MTQKEMIDAVVHYAYTLTNLIGENSIADKTIAHNLFKINNNALGVIKQINLGNIHSAVQLAAACNPMGQVYFEQLMEDQRYSDDMDEWAARQREFHELPY